MFQFGLVAAKRPKSEKNNQVRLVDIVGDGTYQDSSGDVIYDPFPTAESAGFDLDAIGVIHQGNVPVPVPALAPGALWLLGVCLIGLGKNHLKEMS